MPRQHLRFEHRFDATPEQLFALFAEHESFGHIWGTELERVRDGEDPDDVNSVGSVRLCKMGGLNYDETITAYEPPRLIEYKVTRGSAAKNHLGRIVFEPEGEGRTRMIYSIEFDARIPLMGPLVRRFMRQAWEAGAEQRIRAALR